MTHTHTTATPISSGARDTRRPQRRDRENGTTPTRHRRPRGFTLVELMVVAVILVVLAGIIVPQIVGKIGTSRHSVAIHQLSSIENAIQLFYTEYDRYPADLEELVARPADIDEENWQFPTLKRKDLNDPWGRTFIYEHPGENRPFDVHSRGADDQVGGAGEDADVTNWE